jgi:FKBP-type peptidyl-prolyl cis-trans isomerase SlyD
MTLIANSSVVTLDYQLKDDKGNTLDSSKENGPMVYIQGGEDVLQGIEDAVHGLSINDEVTITIPADQAYGEYDESKLASVPISAFSGLDNIYPGLTLQEETASGPVLVTIKEITDQLVQVDANHPLAGQNLTFDLQVVAVREATSEELDHGHVHGEHGHHH